MADKRLFSSDQQVKKGGRKEDENIKTFILLRYDYRRKNEEKRVPVGV